MKKNTRILFLVFTLMIALLMMSRGYSYAKYASNTVWNYYIESKGFYFNSDISTGNTDSNWDGSSISFNVTNFDNDDLITANDISYKTTCTVVGEASSYATCKVNGTDSNIYTGTLTGGVKSTKNDYIDIVSNEELTGLTVNVTVESLSPYHKTLVGEYILNKGSKEIGELKVTYNAGTSSDRVVITNSYNENKCCKLSWNTNKLRIDDNSGDILSSISDGDGYIKDVVFSINKKDSLDFTFYRTDFDENLDDSQFTLVEVNDC